MTNHTTSPTTSDPRNTHHEVSDTRNSPKSSPRRSGDRHDLPLSDSDPKAAKQKATEEKLQMLSTIQAMQQGKMPRNTQLNDLLNKLITNKVISSREHNMSPDGKLLLNDFRKLLKTVQKSLAVKNKDELFQSLVYHLHCMESPLSKDQLGQTIKVTDKNVVNEEGKQGSDALFKIGKLILLNNEFRALLGELIDISQEIFSSVSSKVGDSLSNAGSGLQDDENHPNKRGKNFVDKYLDKVLDHSNKKMENDHTRGLTQPQEPMQDSHHHRTSLHDQEPRLVSSPHDDPRHQGLLNTGDSVHPNLIPGGFPATPSIEGQNAFDQNGQHGALGQQPPHTQPQHGVLGQQPLHTQQHQQHSTLDQDTLHNNQDRGIFNHNNQHHEHGVLGNHQTTSPVTHIDPLQQQHGDPAYNNNNGGTNNYQQKLENNRLYQNARNEMYEHKHHARNTVKEKLPKEKQDELISRLKLAIAQIQKHPEYQGAIQTLLKLLKVWTTRMTQVSEGVKTQAREGDHPQQDNYREQSERELKSIIECWAQGYSIDPLLQGVQQVMRDMQNDQELREFYQQVIRYSDRLVTEPGYVQREESTQEGRQLMDVGNSMIKGKYRENLNYLSSESRKIMNLMAEDEISKELNHRIATIHHDLWMDGEGNPAFKPHLLNDMRMTLLPALIDEIKYIPVPRIDYSDPQFDIVIENLVISGDSLLPNVFETKVESFNSFSLKSDTESAPSHQSLHVRMSEIQADIDDVVFFYNKKTGFPKLSDRGVASLTVGGKGISISLRIQSVVDNPAKTFKVASCKCNVDNLKVKIQDSNHNMLYKAIQPLILGNIRKQIAKVMELKVTELLNKADSKITQTIVEMNQNLQNRAYQALPEHEQNATKPPALSPARSRPGFFSTAVKIINSNIKTKVQKRNEAKRMERMSMSQDSLSSHSKTQLEGGRLNTHPGQFDENSIATDRHHYIASPPLSPTSKAHMPTTNQYGAQPTGNHGADISPSSSHYKLAQDIPDAQYNRAGQQPLHDI
ncbi:uncharacterized protein EV154DRAFT_603139 [Mucor mucedo]|uniref:uncharacterized protein n=1 Tax=Mucor mucedo TaxID=29922 RepID=UPI00221F6BDF|nr:uncharacterized protein EV154DRAFT_603139 [Mucor mucedo]KAI7890628.1 hypothetical protein EV154DRAFT_603139 [Mucor mucedo]